MSKKILLTTIIVVAFAFSAAFYFFMKPSNECDNAKISDIKIESGTDTLSYSLGYVWARNMSRAGLNNISYSFYLGVKDFLAKDTSKMGLYKSMTILDKDSSAIASLDFKSPESTTTLCDIKLSSKADSFSYALGFAWMQGAYKMGIDTISPSIIKGLSDGFRMDTTLYTYQKAEATLNTFVNNLRIAKYADIKKLNDDWLVDNAKKAGIHVLKSGVQYKILKQGNGTKITPDKIIECQYAARTIDGNIYETSPEKPFKFYITGVIPGLADAVLNMRVGDSWEIYIPQQLAYGSGGIKDRVPPFATVIYMVEITGTK